MSSQRGSGDINLFYMEKGKIIIIKYEIKNMEVLYHNPNQFTYPDYSQGNDTYEVKWFEF